MPQYDQFDVALAGVPSDEERQQQVADRLRGQTGLGAYFQTLGDPMTAKAGQNMQAAAVEQTSALQKTRELKDKLAADKLADKQDRALREQLAAIKASEPDYQSPTQGEQDKDASTMQELQEIVNLTSSFEDEFAVMNTKMFKAMEDVGEFPIPGSRAFSNWLVNKAGMDTETAARANQWWKNMNLMFNFPERYKLFGATLTGNEKASWDKVAAGESMDPKAIRLLLDTVNKRAKAKVRQTANLRRSAGFSPGYVEGVFGQLSGEMTPEEIQEEANMGKIPHYEDIGYPNELGEVLDDEADYQRLKQKYGR